MAESTARALIDVGAFLRFEGAPDTRYELIGGEIVAMSPPTRQQNRVASNAHSEISARLEDRAPCGVEAEAGITVSPRDYFVADLAVTCEVAGGEAIVDQPKLVVEVLSPSTSTHDRGVKVPAYCGVESVEEIWLISSMRRHVQLWCRQAEGWLVRDFVEGGHFVSPYLRDEIALARLYRNVVLDDDGAGDASG